MAIARTEPKRSLVRVECMFVTRAVGGNGSVHCLTHQSCVDFATTIPFRKGTAGPIGDQPPFLLSQGGVEVEHKWIGVDAEFSDDEGHSLRHQTRDEGDIPREAIERGDDDRTLRGPSRRERGSEVRPAFQGV